VLLGALLFDFFLTDLVLGLFGLSAGGHGHEAHGSPAALWTVRLLVVGAGAVLGYVMNGPVNHALLRFFKVFNAFFERLTNGYGRIVSKLVKTTSIMLILYGVFMALTWYGFRTVPVGFIPEQDKGYLVVNAMLPDGASLERTEAVMKSIDETVRKTPGVAHTISIPGYSILTSNNISNAGGMFVILAPFEDRIPHGLGASAVATKLRAQFRQVQEAVVVAFGAPPVDGLGNTGGFKLQVQDRADAGAEALQGGVESMIAAGSKQPELVGLFSTFRASQPQLYLDVDRAKAKALGVSLNDVFATLQIYLGSSYANDFTRFGRNWQVNVQADAAYRVDPADIGRLKVRNRDGAMVPLSTLVNVRDTTGPAIVNRYNMFPSAEVAGGTAPGVSSGQAIALMESLGNTELPSTMSFEWTELTLQQILAGNTAVFVFILGAILVFMVLAAQYESWSLPGAIIMIVPMCLLAAIAGMWVVGSDNNIFSQIGLIVLIGLAAKNAILIVEFAKQLQDEGMPRFEAIVTSSKTRLRPILMTSFAFILGVLPLIRGAGAGAEMRFALGIAVFSGMLGVTAFGIFFTPVFYELIRGRTDRSKAAKAAAAPVPHATTTPQAEAS
jgi:multidrug efflux pump